MVVVQSKLTFLNTHEIRIRLTFNELYFSALCLLALVLGNPAKDSKKPANACVTACDDYDPVCARAKNSSKERLLTFGSKCVMNNYNCQHADDRKSKI